MGFRAALNQAKLNSMKKRAEPLGIEILCLNDINTQKLNIKENVSSPLENAKIKALACYNTLKMPLFSCDSGLYINELDKTRQPGINVRGIDDTMNDEQAITHYTQIAKEFGGKVTAQYKNAIVLILNKNQIYEYMGKDIASEPFYIVSKPHPNRNTGFPLDSISVHIESGKYYYDMSSQEKLISKEENGFTSFFKRTLSL